MNEAFLMKMLWNLINRPDDLWCKVLYSKYGRNNDPRTAITSLSYDSPLWKALTGIWDKFQQNIVWNLGNGNHINFWLDKWTLSGDSLINTTSQPVIDTTLSILLGGEEQPQDSSQYRALIRHYQPLAGEWKALWSWNDPHRIQTFIWMAAHERLLTNYRRRIESSRISPTILMEFMRWIGFLPSWWCADTCGHGETNQFLKKAFNAHMNQLLLLARWQKRLKGVLKTLEAIEKVTLSTLVGKYLKKGGSSSTVMVLKMIGWVLLGVEMWGMYLGMSLAWRRGITHLHVESDSEVLIDMLTERIKLNGSTPTLVILIRNLLALSWQVILCEGWARAEIPYSLNLYVRNYKRLESHFYSISLKQPGTYPQK
ncbi:hypothetical protein TSUD_87340 [Trifolium subterraneum]|uniref:RNase H type-1 domain-containing protein n=1 Tax=Trifolium subterraneum TaxID=3900 RepID=A0A2Z6NY83_TRISU|nr:hypothetical protein TSUD_87340 [Trifolium subterraneum]